MKTLKKAWPVILITVIMVAFVVAVIYNKNFKENKKAEKEQESLNQVDEELGYRPEDYITLGQYKGLEYKKPNTTVTESQLKEMKESDLTDYKKVDREAKKGDAVEVSYKAFIDGKEEKNLSTKGCYLIVGEEELDESVDNAILGHKEGYEFELSLENPEYFDMEDDEVSYEGKTVDFKFVIKSVEEPYLRELTDQWVADNYADEDLSTVEDYNKYIYDAILEENKEEADSEEREIIKDMIMKNSTMNGYPDSVYNDIKFEDDADMKYNAEDVWGISLQEYIKDFDIDLEQMYKDDVKWELIKRAIAKKESINVTYDQIQEGYEIYYEAAALDSADEMREKYSDDEVERMVLEDLLFEFLIENANAK